MKLWEKGMAAEIEAEVRAKWKRFSETGDCVSGAGIDCEYCPLQCENRCRMLYPGGMHGVIAALNEEAEL